MAEEEKKPDLLESMDEFAVALLKEAQGGTKIVGEPTSPDVTVSLVDKIKVFSAIREWMNARKEFVPPSDSGKAKGERLRDKFRERTAPPSRRSRSPREAPPDPDSSAGTDAATADTPLN